jgi:hypothetical protein
MHLASFSRNLFMPIVVPCLEEFWVSSEETSTSSVHSQILDHGLLFVQRNINWVCENSDNNIIYNFFAQENALQKYF